MSDEWIPTMKLALSRREFDILPRHPAYKYELIQGETWITPRPRYANAVLRLARFRPDAHEVGNVSLRPANAGDIDALVPIFRGAFGHLQPYGSLDDAAVREVAEKSLRRTFTGGDGPLVEPASFVALEGDRLAGAILITLLPGGDPADWDSMTWREPAPADLWANGQGQPHLTWIFVRRFSQGEGVGTRFLQQAVRALKRQGYKTLWTTFLIGNDSTLLWHWRNGFELLPNMLSKRRMRCELRQKKSD